MRYTSKVQGACADETPCHFTLGLPINFVHVQSIFLSTGYSQIFPKWLPLLPLVISKGWVEDSPACQGTWPSKATKMIFSPKSKSCVISKNHTAAFVFKTMKIVGRAPGPLLVKVSHVHMAAEGSDKVHMADTAVPGLNLLLCMPCWNNRARLRTCPWHSVTFFIVTILNSDPQIMGISVDR